MNTLFTLRGLGHRGRMLAHQLSLERPPRPAHALPGIEFTIIDLDDPRVEVAMLASTISARPNILKRIALVLVPNAFDLRTPPGGIFAIREQYDAWIPVLPYEVVHPHQVHEEGIRKGYLPSLRTIFWRLVRMVQHQGMVKFVDSDFEEFWSGGATLWSFQVSASGTNRASLAADLLESSAAEPLFWNAVSHKWMLQICTSSEPGLEVTMEEIVTVTERFSEEPFRLEGIRWANVYDDDLEDRMVIDVLAIGEPLPYKAETPMLADVHRMS